MTALITSVEGVIITDSRGVPTLSVMVRGSDGSTGSFAVPSGASTGSHEAHELRDDDTSHGNVSHALARLQEDIAPALIGKELCLQNEIDDILIRLDGTPTKDRLGGNTMIGVSIAYAKASAASLKKEVWQYLNETFFNGTATAFPRLYANLINGGKHTKTALSFQEYIVVPKTTNMQEASDTILLIGEKLSTIVRERYPGTMLGDEGGYAVPVSDVERPLALLEEAARQAGKEEEISFALDVAATSFFDKERSVYVIADTPYDTQALTDLYGRVVPRYGLLSIEDPYHEEDFDAFARMRNDVQGLFLRVGDDLTTTNCERLKKAVEVGSIDTIIIKPNQIGTLTETIQTMKYAHEHGVKCIVSHRSGETMDDFIADLSYACGAFGLKLGARGPKEREAKYSRLIEIENTLPHHEN